MGTNVGGFVGANVGGKVGGLVGGLVGVILIEGGAVGINVGGKIGPRVGGNVGGLVGDIVGMKVGSAKATGAVGAMLGTNVGISDGFDRATGLPVGGIEGTTVVGFSVGLKVGFIVVLTLGANDGTPTDGSGGAILGLIIASDSIAVGSTVGARDGFVVGSSLRLFEVGDNDGCIVTKSEGTEVCTEGKTVGC